MKKLLFVLVFASVAFAQTGTKLTVSISGLDNDTGQLIVSVWPGEQSWNDKQPLGRFPVPISNGGAVWTSESLAAGTYAVTVYHDKNLNKKWIATGTARRKKKARRQTVQKLKRLGRPNGKT
ncbi:MAG: DUF2141 domain-containing protein [bacterium]|nr:DUF2141 domain-containing protein [bacterium]